MKKWLMVVLGLWLSPVSALGVFEHLNRVRALHAYQTGNYTAAQQLYESLVVDYPDDDQLLLGLGNTCYAQQQYAQALDYYRLSMRGKTGIAKEPGLFNVGCAQVRLEQLKEALASFEEVVRINAKNQRAQKNCEILRKMLQQQKNSKKDDKKSSKEQSKQTDKQDPGSSDQNNGQQDKQQHDRNGKNTQSNQNKGQRDKADQQKQPNERGFNDAQDARGRQQQDSTSKDNEHEQRKNNPQQPQSSGLSGAQQRITNKQNLPLDQDMQAILQQAGAMEKEGQRLYMQALAGRKKTEGSNVHAW